MTDHYFRSVEHLDEVATHRAELDKLYAAGDPPAQLVAARHDKIRHGLALAKIHATLAEVQGLRALRFSPPIVELPERVS